MVRDASACAQNSGSSNSLIAGILSIGRISGSRSSGIALADVRMKRRRNGRGIIVGCIDETVVYKIQWARNVLYAIFFSNVQRIYKPCFYLPKISLECLLFYAILSNAIYRNPSIIISGLIIRPCVLRSCDWNIQRGRVLSTFKWIDCLSIKWYCIFRVHLLATCLRIWFPSNHFERDKILITIDRR